MFAGFLYNAIMPELPEVETIKNDLKEVILDKKIIAVKVGKKKIIKSDYGNFLKILKGGVFHDISRIGKLIIFYLKGGNYLLIHLKMTGQLIYLTPQTPLLKGGNCDAPLQKGGWGSIAGGHEIPGMSDELPNKYSHVIFKFIDNSALYFNDMRQFGYLKIVGEDELKTIKDRFGIEPLSGNFKFEDFKNIFKGRTAVVKSVLMNQRLIAGIGNIYADEILFKAGIMPTRTAGSLGESELRKIFKAAESILKQAIKYRGTTFSDYVDSRGNKGNFTNFLKVYGREGKKCFKCGRLIEKIKISGRGTRYCSRCQK